MICVTVLYSQTEGARFDWEYYTGKHIPLVRQKLGAALKSVRIERGLAGEGPGTAAPFVALADLLFDSVEAFQTAFGPTEAEIVADIPKYTSIEPVVQISEVVM
jgi:uncharacterized protein (TIGR02118 family)